MMPIYNYTKPHRLSRLHDELLAAGITPLSVLGTDDQLEIDVPDDVTEASVTAVVNAHNPSAIDAAMVAAQQELTGWRATLQTYVDTAAPSNAATVGVVKLIARAILRAPLLR